MAAHKKNIIVIGAGVIGLQTALKLLEEGEDAYQVYVVAEFLPGDEDARYASAWAGAQWRSHEASHTEAASWDAETYKAWMRLVKEEKDCGLALLTGVNFWTSPKTSTASISSESFEKDASSQEPEARVQSSGVHPRICEPWWSTLVSDYRPIEAASLPPGAVFGVTFKSFTIDVTVYLPYLLRKIQDSGGQIHRCKLPTEKGLNDAVELAARVTAVGDTRNVWAVVNASGLGARDLVGDQNLYPIRGQTVHVRGIANGAITKLGEIKTDVTAIMPRPASNCTVIGVTVEDDVWKTEVEEEKVPFLLERGKELAPELLNAHKVHEVLKVGVGLRPARKGGARVELECTPEERLVIHAYGHGGAGYQNSVGCARKVLRLLKSCENK